MTFQEWVDAKGREATGRWEREIVCEGEDGVMGWLRLRSDRDTGLFEALAHPSAEECHQCMLDYSLAHFSNCHAIFCLTIESQGRLQQLVEKEGFEPAAEYFLLLKELAVRVPQPSLAPIHA